MNKLIMKRNHNPDQEIGRQGKEIGRGIRGAFLASWANEDASKQIRTILFQV